jgi:molybdate transport system substrate-binding protein
MFRARRPRQNSPVAPKAQQPRKRGQALIAFGMTLSICGGNVEAADLRVYSGGAPQEVLRLLAPEFERQSGHRVAFTFAVVTEIQRKLAGGESADVVLLPVPLLAATEKSVAMRPEGRAVLARVGIGVIVRQGEKRPDISSSEAVRKMLLEARTIALPEASVPSGRHLTRTFTELGIADAINANFYSRGQSMGERDWLRQARLMSVCISSAKCVRPTI